MKSVFLILMCLICLNAQATESKKREKDPEAMARIRQALDMKVFHDRTYVKEMIKGIYDQDKSGRTSNPDLMNEMGHEGLFSKKDSDIIRQEAAHKVVRTKLLTTPWDDQSKRIDENPFESFIGLIKDQDVPNLNKKELDNLNSVDKTVIPEMILMLGESGPAIGSSPVSVTYDNVDLK